MKELSWTQFDRCVDTLVERFRDQSFSGIYGVPRGGLCLGVALSHALQRPLQHQPDADSLIVDDVYESGRTLLALRSHWPEATFVVWISKVTPVWWSAAELSLTSEWLLFPWENAYQARADEQAYRASRGDS